MRGDYEAALEFLHATLQEFPDNKHVYNNIGLTYLAQKDYPKALGCFQKAIAIDPQFPEPRNNMGMAWLDYGAIQAREAFESLVETNPDFFDGLMNLAALCYREGDRPRARQLWQRAYALRPDDAQVKRNLGIPN
jgi:tetratricopeptide (TPR) repeat protein